MWAELSRYSVAHGVLVARNNVTTDSWNHAAEMDMINDGKPANTGNMFVKQRAYRLPRAGLTHPLGW